MRLFFENSGATFSPCNKYRYSLWRVWDNSKPCVMFIGLNPSTANAEQDDPTIQRVCSIANNNGFGGIYMMNCWPFISPDPKVLLEHLKTVDYFKGEFEHNNISTLKEVRKKCSEVVCAWGSFDIVKNAGKDIFMKEMFPGMKTLKVNKDGSPKHPLYCRKDSKFIPYV